MKKNEKNQSNPIFILIVFLLVIVVFIALPYIKGSTKSSNGIIPNINNKTTTKAMQKTEEAFSDYILIDEKKDISFNNLVISNPTISDNRLILTVYSDRDINLSKVNYYIEFYKDKSKFLFRRSLKGIVSSKEKTEIIVDDVILEKNVYIAISHISDSAIPKKKFTTDESGISGFKCSKKDTTYEYDFLNNKLIRVVSKYNYSNNNLEEFSSKLFENQKEANQLNNQKGITASIVESNKEFIYTIEVDYTETLTQNIDPYFYTKDELNYIVLFKMDAEGFECL